jgi:hypothetical protein
MVHLSLLTIRRAVLVVAAIGAIFLVLASNYTRAGARKGWSELPTITMHGGLRVYWRVYTDKGNYQEHAEAHGFLPLTEVGTYSDYPGNQRQSIGNFLGQANRNPWNKPSFFERVIRRNIDQHPSTGTYVHYPI